MNLQQQRIKEGAERAKQLREGMDVRVQRDDGSILDSRAMSDPWPLGSGHWVIKVEGFHGGYDVLRVWPAVKPRMKEAA